ncbi:hypothetical protein ABEB36_002414 [Hypothenemus hampei]|uniref:Uncharacterized protein n=1 Tax=Hypothenemus hampei TaxID=57062 RepID=A0ABD1F6B8_HYPHA
MTANLSNCIHFFYNATLHTLLMSTILEIKRKLVIVNNQSSSDVKIMDVTTMYASINQAIEAGKAFNRLFGYQLLIYYFRWFVFLLHIQVDIVVFVINPETYYYPSTVLGSVCLVTCSIILETLGPCAIAFACDMVATEADKLMATCYAAQEKFHYNSREYQELQSLGSILGSGVLQFTAAKFMEIKRSTILSIMAAATTYFIAIVQFY